MMEGHFYLYADISAQILILKSLPLKRLNIFSQKYSRLQSNEDIFLRLKVSSYNSISCFSWTWLFFFFNKIQRIFNLVKTMMTKVFFIKKLWFWLVNDRWLTTDHTYNAIVCMTIRKSIGEKRREHFKTICSFFPIVFTLRLCKNNIYKLFGFTIK